MIVITAKTKIKPQKKMAFMELAEKVIAASRKEKDCISYNLYSETDDPNGFLFFEEWKNQEAIESHFRYPHFIDFTTKSKDMMDGDMDINIYDAERKLLDE